MFSLISDIGDFMFESVKGCFELLHTCFGQLLLVAFGSHFLQCSIGIESIRQSLLCRWEGRDVASQSTVCFISG